jgi:hypothetical protein
MNNKQEHLLAAFTAGGVLSMYVCSTVIAILVKDLIGVERTLGCGHHFQEDVISKEVSGTIQFDRSCTCTAQVPPIVTCANEFPRRHSEGLEW